MVLDELLIVFNTFHRNICNGFVKVVFMQVWSWSFSYIYTVLTSRSHQHVVCEANGSINSKL